MKISRIHRITISLIAVCAILLNALMPTVALAVNHSTLKNLPTGAAWIEVCSGNNSVWIRLGTDGQTIERTDIKPADAPITGVDEHCPYCATQAFSYALPPSHTVTFTSFIGQHALAADLPTELVSTRHWHSPAVRAPPVITL